jgi:hypothetical protein
MGAHEIVPVSAISRAYLWLLSICSVVYAGNTQGDLGYQPFLPALEGNSNRGEESGASTWELMSSGSRGNRKIFRLKQDNCMYSINAMEISTIDRDNSK